MLDVSAAPKLDAFALLFGLVAILEAYAPRPLFINDAEDVVAVVDVIDAIDVVDVVGVFLDGIEKNDDDVDVDVIVPIAVVVWAG